MSSNNSFNDFKKLLYRLNNESLENIIQQLNDTSGAFEHIGLVFDDSNGVKCLIDFDVNAEKYALIFNRVILADDFDNSLPGIDSFCFNAASVDVSDNSDIAEFNCDKVFVSDSVDYVKFNDSKLFLPRTVDSGVNNILVFSNCYFFLKFLGEFITADVLGMSYE